MPWTLYRYILREILKLLLLSAGVLVVVISFAASVRPLSEGVLGPWALFKFVLYTAPTMLGFALPFAGAFASTLVFLRMAGDNEVTACSASGLSYAWVLMPVLLLGVSLTMGLFFMSNYVLPWFYREATRVVEQDLVTALVAQLDKRQPYVMDREGYVIYADRADEVRLNVVPEQPGGPVPEKAIVLRGVAMGVIDDAGRVRSDVTAKRAELVVFRDEALGGSWVNMTFEEVMFYDDVDGELAYSQRLSPRQTMQIPSPFADRVEFLSWPQLRRLRSEPFRYDKVQRYARQLVDALAGETLLQSAEWQLRESADRVLVLSGTRAGERYLVRSPRTVRRGTALVLTGSGDRPVTIESERAGQIERRYEAQQATLALDARALGEAEPTLAVVMSGQVRVFLTRRADGMTEHAELPMPQMMWPTWVLGVPRKDVGVEEALTAAAQPRFSREARGAGPNPVANLRNRVTSAKVELFNRITSQLHSRAASAIACTLLLLLGAVLSMKLKDQMALVVYFWSFLLAVLTIIIIHTGDNLVHGGSSLGGSLAVMWSGNVILAVVVGWSYCRLARH